MKKNRIIILIVSIISLFLDQISKFIVGANLELNEEIIVINNFFNITKLYNTGAAFSMLEGKTIILIIITIICLYFIFKIIKDEKKLTNLKSISYGLLIGGVFGNLIDRIFFRSVRDFISIKIINYYFPVFNIADSFIVISIIILMILALKEKKNESSK